MALLGSNNPKLTALLYGEIPQGIAQGKEIIRRALNKSKGNVKEAANLLDISRATLNRWLDDFGLRRQLGEIRAQAASTNSQKRGRSRG